MKGSLNNDDRNGNWDIKDSAECYGIEHWSNGYFRISEKGEIIVIPEGRDGGPEISLMEVVRGLKGRGHDMPVLLRIPGILDSRIRKLNTSFKDMIAEYGYRNTYRGVYPIKVNQQQQVVEEIAHFGRQYHHGFEAGSKAELIAAISFINDPEAYLVCNGYKDEEFINLGLYARKMGIRCLFVVETPSECSLIISRARALNVDPLIGVRMKLSSQASGHWTDSGGERSVFGLNTAQVLDLVEELRNEDMLHTFKLLHFHLGSQITNIRDIREGVIEASRIYAGLVREGAAMEVLDLGGGLAVDYDGSHTDFTSSCNYSLEEYCAAVIEGIISVLDEQEVPHPVIVTESGRATVAYYSILLFNIHDVTRFEIYANPDEQPADCHEILKSLREVIDNLDDRDVQECYHDVLYYRDEGRQLFKHGNISLRERALIEQLFWNAMTRIAAKIQTLDYVPDEFEGIGSMLADIYYGNFSLFQSLPDVWAIDQIFPVMPIHRLHERPTRQAIIADITCDCDGKIDRFSDLRDVKRTLPLHELRDGEEYILGAFLVGAYQETLGDLHNLLGDTNVISITFHDNGVEFTREIDGDTVADVLSYVEYDTKAMILRVRQKAERAVTEQRITIKERRDIVEAYRAGLDGYTYFET